VADAVAASDPAKKTPAECREAVRAFARIVTGNSAKVTTQKALLDAGGRFVRDVTNWLEPPSSGSGIHHGDQNEAVAQEAWLAERVAQAHLVRDIFGNPFKAVSAAGAGASPDALKLAQSIYAEQAFERLPDLAVALEQGGCRNAELLTHFRAGGVHVRGCWAIDGVLGKA
jgi:hypothetical protein